MFAHAVVDAAALGLPVDVWLGYTGTLRAAIVAEHNSRLRKKP